MADIDEIAEARRASLLESYVGGRQLTESQLGEISDLITEKGKKGKRKGGRPAADGIRWTLNNAAREFGIHREQLARRARRLDIRPEADGRYSSIQIKSLLLGTVENAGEYVSPEEAARLLTIARRQEIDLNMEVTRKERIPLDDVTEVNEECLSDLAGLLKANSGKEMTEEVINDLFACARAIGSKLRDLAA